MDNLTHALTGTGIAAFAYGSQSVAGDPKLGQAVFWAVMLASQFPDFDFVIRMRGKIPYLKHHRGFSHSVPAQLIIPTVSTLLVSLFFPGKPLGIIWFWAWLATLLHLTMDLLTSYGTKLLWPFKTKMYALDILLIIDPVIIILTGTGAALWYWRQAPPELIFEVVFALIGLYLLVRWYVSRRLRRRLAEFLGSNHGPFSVIPTMHLLNWNFVAETPKSFLAGVINWPGQIEVEKTFPKLGEDRIIAAAWEAPGARVFIEFARHMWVDYIKTEEGYKVYFQDLRFLFGDRTPFTATVILDNNLNLIDEDFGWRSRV